MKNSAIIQSPRLTPKFIGALHERVRMATGLGKNDSAGSVRLIRTFERALDAVAREVQPKVMYRTLPVTSVTHARILTDAGPVASRKLARLADLCRGDRCVVFAIATIGEGFERLYRGEQSLSNQFIFDAVGSECAELVMDGWNEKLNAHMKRRGYETSLRFSPGYCDWKLEGQATVFAALDAAALGVRLTAEYLMIPSKSISAVSLAAREVPVAAPCAFCNARACPYRRMEYQPNG